MADLKRILAVTGIVAPILAMIGVFVPTFLTPTFGWTETSISHMGGVGRPYAWLFNWTVVVAGVVGLPFVARLWIGASNLPERVGTLLFGLSVIGLIGVGLNPVSGPGGEGSDAIHMLSALTHFLSYTFGLWVYGSGSVLDGRENWGLTTLWLGIVHVTAWIGYLIQLVVFSSDPPLEGIALPEAVGSVVFAGWLVVMAVGYLTGNGPAAAGTPSRADASADPSTSPARAGDRGNE